MEDLFKLIRIILEKHLIPTIAAAVGMLIIVVIIPESNWTRIKLGESWFKVLWFGTCFLIIELLVYIYKRITHCAEIRKESNIVREEEQKHIEAQWQNVFDHLTEHELSVIRELAQNGNMPVKRLHLNGPNIHSNYLRKDYRDDYVGISNFGNKSFQTEVYICTEGLAPDENGNQDYFWIYKLQENAYNVAKFFLEKNGRLSTYEDIEQEVQ